MDSVEWIDNWFVDTERMASGCLFAIDEWTAGTKEVRWAGS